MLHIIFFDANFKKALELVFYNTFVFCANPLGFEGLIRRKPRVSKFEYCTEFLNGKITPRESLVLQWNFRKSSRSTIPSKEVKNSFSFVVC